MKTKILMVALMLLAMTPAIQAKSSTKTVAHRGYWKCEGSAENSLTSLQKLMTSVAGGRNWIYG